MHRFRQLINLYSPEDVPGVGTGDLSRDDILDNLNLDETPDEPEETIDLNEKDKPTGEKTDLSDPDEDETDEEVEKSLEDELEEEIEEKELDDEDLELIAPVRRKDILAKYPNVFKDFPFLEKAYYKEQKYSELLPTIEDAEVAVEKSERLDHYGQELAQGDSRSILRDTKQANPEAFNKIVDQYLPALFEVDQQAYYHVVGNISKDIIKHMVDTSRSSNDKELFEAAKTLNKFLFNTTKYEPPTRLSKGEEKNTKEEELKQKEAEFWQHRAYTAIEELETKVKNTVRSALDKNIDPKNTMDAYVRKNAIKDAADYLEEAIEGDARFKKIVAKMMVKAGENEFDAESMGRIRSAYMAKAKSLLPEIIKKVRKEALGRGSKSSDNKGPLPVGKHRTATSKVSSGKSDSERAKAIPRGTSTLDFLSSD